MAMSFNAGVLADHARQIDAEMDHSDRRMFETLVPEISESLWNGGVEVMED